MKLAELKQKIIQKQARIGIIGLGYVGLPVACSFASAGFDVLGVERNAQRVAMVNAGVSPITGNEPGLQDLLAKVVSAGWFQATTDYEALKDRDIVLICVDTPVDTDHNPQFHTLTDALDGLGEVMKPGTLIIIESTTAPGTMRDMIASRLETSTRWMLNEDFFLGNCPERVMPGKLLENLREVDRVVGGMTPETSQAMIYLYKHIVDADLEPTDCTTAELVKTVENTYRDVQIAFANEVALICEGVGGDVWSVRELVNKSPGRMMLLPGAGVGGHCIPKDPWLLASSVKDMSVPVQLIPAARRVNEYMPFHVVEIILQVMEEVGLAIDQARILVLGYAYLEGSDDSRNSPSENLIRILESKGAQLVIHDAYIQGYQGSVEEIAGGCDVAVLMVKHQDYRTIDLRSLCSRMRTPILIDGRGFFSPVEAINAGFIYRGIGRSKLQL